MTSCMAIIPYTPPIFPEEFIRKEVEKGWATGTISLIHQPSLPKEDISVVSEAVTRFIKSCNGMDFMSMLNGEELHSIELALLVDIPFLFESTDRVDSVTKLDGDKIAEALQSELAITTADDARPIVATYGCSTCVAVGGYDRTNKIAFVVHFANAAEVRKSGGWIFWNISKLVKTSVSSPIQLHLRGGHKGQSETTIEAIKFWMTQRRSDLPMEIASEEILTNGLKVSGKSLSIDSRTGEVSEYSPLANAKSRDFSELDVMDAISRYKPKITLAYFPKLPHSY